MRPDPRLLLPASAVRRVPDGARVWDRIDRYGIASGVGRHFAEGPTVWVCWSDWPRSTVPAKHLLIDLSAPVDGERLDALPWGLRQLHPDAVTCRASGPPGIWQVTLHDSDGSVIVEYAEPRAPSDWGCTILDPWPDLSGLTPEDVARAVVVAALVAQGGAR